MSDIRTVHRGGRACTDSIILVADFIILGIAVIADITSGGADTCADSDAGDRP